MPLRPEGAEQASCRPDRAGELDWVMVFNKAAARVRELCCNRSTDQARRCSFTMNAMKTSPHALFLVALAFNAAAEGGPPASPEVTAAMKPYLATYKLAGVVSIIADKSGKVHYRNLLGYADVEANQPIREDNMFWIASM